MNGFYVVRKGGKYYKGSGDYVLEKSEAYAFVIQALAQRLADRICGKVERV